MPSYLPIGIGAGLCAAVLYASAVLGQSMLGIFLLLIVPLPKYLAGLGWGWKAAATAAVIATVLVTAVANPRSGLIYGVSQGLPAVWLCYLAYLHRDPDPGSSQPAEWYPIGRLLLWAAAFAGGLATLTLLILGSTPEALREQVGRLVEMFAKSLGRVDPNAPAQIDSAAMVDMMLELLPAAFAVSGLFGILINLWLAARITRASGRLLRPWPDLAAVALPPGSALVLAASTALALPSSWTGMPEYPRYIATGVASAMFLAYVLVGLAVIHYVSRGWSWRPALLTAVYIVLLLLNPWSGLIIALIALSEPFAPWRRRFVSPSPPIPPLGPPPGGPST